MAVNGIAEELMKDIDMFQHTKVARHIPRSMEVSLDYFEWSGLAREYFLDIYEVYLPPKRKNSKKRTVNPDHIYQIFGRYSHESPEVVRTSIVDFITCDPESFKERLVVVFTMLRLDFDSWLLKTKNPSSPADEASLYGLCQLYSCHALAFTTGSVWNMLELHGNFTVNDLKKHCDVHLVFLEGGILANLLRKPQIPRLMGHPSKNTSYKPPVLFVSDSETENMCMVPDKTSSLSTNVGDHTYSSPLAHAVWSNKLFETNQHTDHTYAELSDVPIEPCSSNSDDVVTTGGKLVISRSEQVEISVKYQCNIAFPEATVVTNSSNEAALDAQLEENSTTNKVLPDESSIPNMPKNTSSSDATNETQPKGSLLDKTNAGTSNVESDDMVPPQNTQNTLPDETEDTVNDVLHNEPKATQSNEPSPPGKVNDAMLTMPSNETNEEPLSESGETTLDEIELPEDTGVIDTVDAPKEVTSEPLDSSSVKSANLNDNSLEIENQESESNKNKKAILKSCIIRLTELSMEERKKWMQKNETIDTLIGNPSQATPSRYYMRDRPITTTNQTLRSSGRKLKIDYQNTDKDLDSDYEPVLPAPPPLDNKRFPSSNRMAIQQEIMNNKNNKRGNNSSRIVSQSPVNKPKGNSTSTTVDPSSPGKNNDNTPPIKKPKTDTTTEPGKTNDIEPVKGFFKTKQIIIRRSKDPRTFKCSQCDHRTSSIRELNQHFIAKHRKVQCDICSKSFNTPAAMRKHRYSHVEENSQFKCQSCDKMFPFESQLKSHRHMHRRGRNYICAAANCPKSFKHPGDLAAHARSHESTHSCAHCSYTNADIRNLRSHLRTHSRETPFKCKLCGVCFVHSNQLVRHRSKCPKNVKAE